MENILGIQLMELCARLDLGMEKREKSNMTERFLAQMSAGETITH